MTEQLSAEQYEATLPIAEICFGDRVVRYCTPSKMTQWRIDNFFSKEPDTLAWIASFEQGDRLLDIGANVGMYSIWAAVTKGAKVYACEPEAQNFAVLNKNIMLNNLQDEVRPFCLALSDQQAIDYLYLATDQIGGSCHTYGEKVDFKQAPLNPVHVQGCAATTVDNLIADAVIPMPTHIKIDVDGIEPKIIKGMAKTLSDPALQSVLVEVDTSRVDHQPILELMQAAGFVLNSELTEQSLRTEGSFKGIGNHIFFRKQSSLANKLNSYARKRLLPETKRHMLDKLNASQFELDPFPHFFIEDIFPEQFYQEILAALPTNSEYITQTRTGRVLSGEDTVDSYRHTYILNPMGIGRMEAYLSQQFWRELVAFLCGDFSQLLLHKCCALPECTIDFSGTFNARVEALLAKDYTGYGIEPHTDAKTRLLSLLFYLPIDDQLMDYGTSLYRVTEQGAEVVTDKKSCARFSDELFDEVKRVPFKRNSVVGFLRSDTSFHGVKPIMAPGIERNALQYMLKKVEN